MNILRRLCHRSGTVVALVTVALSLTLITPRDASALTIVLDFTTTDTDVFGEQTGAFDHTTFGFTGGLTNAQVQALTLAAVIDHYHGYPTVGADGNSPLPDGRELDIDFEIGTTTTAPTNGDTEWWAIKIGTGLGGDGQEQPFPNPNTFPTPALNPNIFGAACLDCVRDAAGASDVFGIRPLGNLLVGSIWTDHIAGAGITTNNNAEIINLIAGTISHEIGHTLSLLHLGAQDANPGGSAWGVMGSGATFMPTSQRVLEREWTYDNMGNLITSVGLRDVAVVAVPEPGTLALFGIGLLLLAGRRRRFS